MENLYLLYRSPSNDVSKKVEIDGYSFRSYAELQRYLDLRGLERMGEIASIVVHPRFPLMVDKVPVRMWTRKRPETFQTFLELSFSYVDLTTDELRYESVDENKSLKRSGYPWFKRLLHFIWRND